MVKHQRQPHQRGLHSNDILCDFTSESDIGESASTPGRKVSWPTQLAVAHLALSHGHLMQRATSSADFGRLVNYYGMEQHLAHSHSMPAEGREYHPQDPDMQMVHRAGGMPRPPHYVIDRNNPGIATMNTAVPQAYHVSPQQVERPTL